jgi:hypothetical protein
MAKADGVSTAGSDRAASMPARITSTRQRRTDPEPEHSIELVDAIETERARLMKAQAILSCTLVAMECGNNADAPYYPDVLRLAQELVSQSIDQLDSLRLRPMIHALRRAEPPSAPSEKALPEIAPREKNELRDSANVIYAVSTIRHALPGTPFK